MLEKGSWCPATQTWTCSNLSPIYLPTIYLPTISFFASFFCFVFHFHAHLGVRLALPRASPQVPSCISGVLSREHHCGARRSPHSTSGSSWIFAPKFSAQGKPKSRLLIVFPIALDFSAALHLSSLVFFSLFSRIPDHSLELFPRGPFQHFNFLTDQDGWRAHGRRPRGRREAAQVAGSLGAALLQQASSLPALQPLHTDADANCLRCSYNHHGERHSSFADVEPEQVLANR